MKIEILRFYRNLLFRTLLMIFCLNVFMFSTTLAMWDTWSAMISSWFRMPVESLGPIMLCFFSAVKFFAIYIILAPALALHWSIKTLEKSA